MKIDSNEQECRAMELFRAGQGLEARRLQEDFLRQVQESDTDYCTCPGKCKWHGKCVECVIIHRGHGDHLPHCFRQMVNDRIEKLSELTEHSFKRQTGG